MAYSKRILVIRLSALGDVAILQPIIRMRAESNPDVLFLLAAPPLLKALFDGIPNLQFVPTIKKQSSWQLFKQLKSLHPDIVADMHHVNRVIRACWLFRLNGTPVHAIKKHTHTPIPSWKRYNRVFDRCGLSSPTALSTCATQYWQPKENAANMRVIGIAPFAQHQGKIWPTSLMEKLIATLDQSNKYRILLFGSKSEAATLEKWESEFAHVESLAGKHPFEKELDIISQLDLMVSMDSANMHFASCLGVPVVSIWGATHPSRGFYGWRQNPNWAIQDNTFNCRPCSKYGNKPCSKGNYPCLHAITPEMVFEKIKDILQ
ncbi:MAG: glycosyltransferase family 9 protein [Bacteroidales bacterium]|nr:glycosyltransferase family 9 protein [Candidatus Colimorpha merdihippi]